MDVDKVVHFASGEALAEVSRANGGLIERDMRNAHRAREVLREIVAWREHEAKRRDRPRGRILRDESLVEIARRAPATVAALGALRGVQPSQVEKYGEALVAAVQQGLAVKDHEIPQIEKRKRIDPETAGLADLLGTALKVRAVEAAIAPQLLATSPDLEVIALYRGTGPAEQLPLLQGWRRALAGEHLLKVLQGRLAVGYDSEVAFNRAFKREFGQPPAQWRDMQLGGVR
jgi:ribonuclease D